MAHQRFYIPDHRLLLPDLFEPGRKPVEPVNIDRDHWFGKHISLCFPLQTAALELVTKVIHPRTNDAHFEGNRLVLDGVNDYIEFGNGVYIFNNAPWTILVKCKIGTKIDNYPGISVLKTNTADEFRLFTPKSDTGYQLFTFGVGSTFEPGRFGSEQYSIADAVGKELTLAISFNGISATDLGNFTASLNGKISTIVSSGGIGTADFNNNIGRGGNDWDGDISLFAIANIGLTPGKLNRLTRNPYQFLKPVIDAPLTLYYLSEEPGESFSDPSSRSALKPAGDLVIDKRHPAVARGLRHGLLFEQQIDRTEFITTLNVVSGAPHYTGQFSKQGSPVLGTLGGNRCMRIGGPGAASSEDYLQGVDETAGWNWQELQWSGNTPLRNFTFLIQYYLNDSPDSWEGIFSAGVTAGGTAAFQGYWNGGMNVAMGHYSNDVIANWTPKLRAWNTLVVTVSEARLVQVWENGRFIDSGIGAAITGLADPLAIGLAFLGGSNSVYGGIGLWLHWQDELPEVLARSLSHDPYQVFISATDPPFVGFEAGSAGQIIAPTGVASAELFGSTILSPGAISILANAIASAEAHGALSITTGAVTIDPAGIISAEAFGATGVLNGAALIAALGIVSAEAFGALVFQPGAVTVDPAGVASAEAFGALEIAPGAILVAPSGITSGEWFGDSLVIPQLKIIEPTGIDSDELFGALTIVGGTQLLGWLVAEIQARAALNGTIDSLAALNGTIESLPGMGADIRINWDD